MEEKTKTKIEVKIDLPVIKVSLSTEADSENIEQTMERMVDEILKVNKKLSKTAAFKSEDKPEQAQIMKQPLAQQGSIDEPLFNLANRLEIDVNQLRTALLLGIKNEKVQIFKPQKFTPAEAATVLIFCYEVGLKRPFITYEELKEAYQDSNIKGQTPFKMVIINIKNSGYIDKRKYENKEIILTSKGAEKAIEYLKRALGNN